MCAQVKKLTHSIQCAKPSSIQQKRRRPTEQNDTPQVSGTIIFWAYVCVCISYLRRDRIFLLARWRDLIQEQSVTTCPAELVLVEKLMACANTAVVLRHNLSGIRTHAAAVLMAVLFKDQPTLPSLLFKEFRSVRLGYWMEHNIRVRRGLDNRPANATTAAAAAAEPHRCRHGCRHAYLACLPPAAHKTAMKTTPAKPPAPAPAPRVSASHTRVPSTPQYS